MSVREGVRRVLAAAAVAAAAGAAALAPDALEDGTLTMPPRE